MLSNTKPVTKGQILCDSTYMMYWEQSDLERWEECGCQGLGGGGWELVFNMGIEFPFRVIKMFCRWCWWWWWCLYNVVNVLVPLNCAVKNGQDSELWVMCILTTVLKQTNKQINKRNCCGQPELLYGKPGAVAKRQTPKSALSAHSETSRVYICGLSLSLESERKWEC